MLGVSELMETARAGVIAADSDFKIIYQNEMCRQIFQNAFGRADFVGEHMKLCHKPETTALIDSLYEQYRRGERDLYHFRMEGDGGSSTLVDVPFFQDGEFAGVVEFIFMDELS
jgi:DUF438 domain-containing protein